MVDRTGKPEEPLLDPQDLPPSGGQAALDEVARLKREPSRFSCLGLGCLPWLVMLAAAILLWLVLR